MNVISCIDKINILSEPDMLTIEGWFICTDSQNVRISLNINGHKADSEIIKVRRKDVYEIYKDITDEEDCGFVLNADLAAAVKIKKVTLELESGQQKTVLFEGSKHDITHYMAKKNKRHLMRQTIKNMNPQNVKKGIFYIKKHGWSGLKEKLLCAAVQQVPYDQWFRNHKVTTEELEAQERFRFSYQPKISILVPTYHTPIPLLQEMISSVSMQSYGNWELCIADGSGGDQQLENILKKAAQDDERIKIKILSENKGISENTNEALALATGQYIGLLDHDDILEPDAFYEIVHALQDQTTDIVYTDEDKITADSSEYLDPNFKPDFSIDLFRSHNYITHFFCCRKQLIDLVGGFNSSYDGAQDYDLMFRCIEKARSIKHIPKVLYHWRICPGSVADNPESKMYAYEAGRRAIEDHLKRIAISAVVNIHENKKLWGMYHVIYDTPGNPLVSIIIPNMDHIHDLDQCIQSILKVNQYENIEIIVVENNSSEKKTFEYYKKLKDNKRIRVIYWEGVFNYSAINNFAVKQAKGDYIFLLNNDTELISPNGISEMLGICMRSEVGIVGAKLYFGDDTIQHAGIVLGFGGFAGHVFSKLPRQEYGYMLRPMINCNYSAVTAACLMTKRSVWNEVNGLSENFAVALNDVDFCMKVRSKGYLVVYNAFSEWYHYESKSRGYEDTPEKKARFAREVAQFQNIWDDELKKGDPYYNKNFPLTREPFTLG